MNFENTFSGCIAAALLGITTSAFALPTALLTRSDVADMSDAGGRAGLTLVPGQCLSDKGIAQFCASITRVIRGSGFETSGLAAGDRIVAVEAFRPADLDTAVRLISSFPPNSPLNLTVISARDGGRRQIEGHTVARSTLVMGQATLPQVTVVGKKSDEVSQYIARAKAKEQCEHEHPKTVPNVVGGAVGTKVGGVIAPVACAPFLGTIAVGDPGLAYLACTAVVTIAGTASGVVIASDSVDNVIKNCTDTLISKAANQ